MPNLQDLYREAVSAGIGGILGTPWRIVEYSEKSVEKFRALRINLEVIRDSKYGDYLLQNASEDPRVMRALEVYAGDCNRAGKDLGLRSRVIAHIGRLTDPERTDTERDFGLAFLRTWRPFPTNEISDEIWHGSWRVMAAESEDTTMFWTFAPYLFANLRKREVSVEDTIVTILKWGAKAKGDPLARNITLRGLEELPRTYILTKDPNSATHQYTKAKAELITKLL